MCMAEVHIPASLGFESTFVIRCWYMLSKLTFLVKSHRIYDIFGLPVSTLLHLIHFFAFLLSVLVDDAIFEKFK